MGYRIFNFVGISDVFTCSEVFVADRGCTLSALDLRNGRVIYSYKGSSAFAY